MVNITGRLIESIKRQQPVKGYFRVPYRKSLLLCVFVDQSICRCAVYGLHLVWSRWKQTTGGRLDYYWLRWGVTSDVLREHGAIFTHHWPRQHLSFQRSSPNLHPTAAARLLIKPLLASITTKAGQCILYCCHCPYGQPIVLLWSQRTEEIQTISGPAPSPKNLLFSFFFFPR